MMLTSSSWADPEGGGGGQGVSVMPGKLGITHTSVETSRSCADPESFVRGGQTPTFFSSDLFMGSG